MIYKSDGDKLIVTDGNIGSSRKVEFYANTKFWIVKQWLYNFGTSYFYAKQAKVNMDVVKRSTR